MWLNNVFSKIGSYLSKLLFSLSLLYLVLNLETGAKSFPTDSSQSSKTDNGVRQLTIPGYSDNGMLAWELKANEVNFESNGSYRAYDLILETMTGFNRSSANSKEGMFNPKHGKAWGDSQLAVNGNGFWAEGDQWLWENEIEDGNQLMAFQDNGRVLFAENLQLSKEGDGDKSPKLKNTPLETPKVEDRFKTKSQADYIEIIEISPTRNRFLLEGQVRVHSPSLQIECDWMEILFDKDTNQTKKLSLGKISLINARRNVKMVQGGRKSFADKLVVDLESGEARLQGSAKVEDELYGIAQGEEIILERGKRKAMVMGNKNARPTLQLPEIPNFGFPLKN